ncbi:MAG: hypothetical protein P1V51_03925 [Deltaproteobacteria bacterium]|nr:hypothetical protein [Deltaproteobacteria bacterium]
MSENETGGAGPAWRQQPELLAGAGLLGLFLLLKTYGLQPAASDENIYFYLAARAAEGVLPYRDAFFAHPPVHLLPGTLLALLFSPGLLLFKTIAPLSAAGAGLLLWRVAHRRLGRLEGLLTLLLFLSAHDLLRASSHHTGVNLGLLLLCLGLYLLDREKEVWAGVAIAGSALTAFYLAPAGAALALVHLYRDRRRGLRLIASGTAAFLAVNLLFLLVAGGAYWDQVYGYHLKKPEVEDAIWGAIKPVTFRNATLIWALAMAPGALLARHLLEGRKKGEGRGPPLPRLLLEAGAMVLATLLLLSLLGRLYHFYFLAGFPGLALLGGWGYGAMLRRLAEVHTRREEAGHDRRMVAGLLLCLLGLGAFALRQAALSGLSWYQEEKGQVRAYVWTPSPVLPSWVDGGLKAVFWKEQRTIGGFSLGLHQYLWHESRVFEAGEALAREVQARVPPGGTLFGDSTSVPLIALLADRHLANHEADTNFMRFRSGVTPTRDFLDRLAAAPPAAVILRPGRGVATVPGIQGWVDTHYRVVHQESDPYQGRYLLYLPR